MMRPRRRPWAVPALPRPGRRFPVTPVFGRADDAPAGRQYALLVGVRNYDKDQLRSLRYTENDVNGLAAVLKDAGYKRVVLMTQAEAAAESDPELLPTGKNIRRQLQSLLEDRKPGDGVLVAFSGHGVQPRGEKGSYFCPMDAEVTDLATLVSLADLYKALEDCKASSRVLLVDACRNDPLAAGDKGLPRLKLESVTRPQSERPPGGVAALFSCSEGQKSYESAKFKQGIFFHFVVEGLKGAAANKKGEVTLEHLAAYVKDEAPDAAKDEFGVDARQRPQLVGDLSGGTPLLERRQLGRHAFRARIEAGRFLMGSPKDEKGRVDHEGPQHTVEITRPFFLATNLVTVGQFRAFANDSGYRTLPETDGQGAGGYDAATRQMVGGPQYTWRHTGWGQTDAHPVVDISWPDAKAFCAWLSKKEGKAYDLPTEAEWEYACRAGTKTRYWCGDRDEDLKGNANVADASLKVKWPEAGWGVPWDDGYPFTAPVGTFQPNPWGLYDMHGQVWQWCADWYGPYEKGSVKDPKGPGEGTERVLRGGSCVDASVLSRSASRHRGDPAFHGSAVGFRVVLRSGPSAP